MLTGKWNSCTVVTFGRSYFGLLKATPQIKVPSDKEGSSYHQPITEKSYQSTSQAKRI